MDKLEKANKYLKKNKVKLKDRPLFHLSPEIGWINDPNGFSEFNGKKHLFYQYNPYSLTWDSIHWGHAQSDDFIKWEYLPVIMAPDQQYDSFGCFSGSALETEEGHLLAYTGAFKNEGDDGYQEECDALGSKPQQAGESLDCSSRLQ